MRRIIRILELQSHDAVDFVWPNDNIIAKEHLRE